MAPSTPPFTNPFQSDRRDSSSSSGSEYLRPNAFAGHRDTLARVPGVDLISNDQANGSEADSSSAPSSISIDSSAFPGHRDTLARIPRVHRRGSVDVPASVVNRLLVFLPHPAYLSLRLVCRHWYKCLPQPRPRSSHRLPPEVLHIIFKILEPSDFDAARHVNKQWFSAGMDLALLRSMLRSAYCQQAFEADVKMKTQAMQEPVQQTDIVPSEVEATFSAEWLMAKRLATTSRLSSGWRGRRDAVAVENRLHLVEEINFQKLFLRQTIPVKIFTVSACGKYVLIVSGQDVFVYKSGGTTDSMEAVVRLAADREVLQISMDTSSGRYAVAALLENRVGILWDLNDEEATGPSDLHSGEVMALGMRTEVHGPLPVTPAETKSSALPLRRENIDQSSGSGILMSSLDCPEVSHTNSEQKASSNSLFGGPHDLCSTPEDEGEAVATLGGITTQSRVSALYRNLGNSDDEPRSVAICPQRKCVAFGCRLGIELHWVDALTGGDLNRWFPLAAPSDFLYFLPQRVVDSSKKLRLISSAASPSSSPPPSRADKWPTEVKERSPTHDRGRRQSMTRLFFGNLPFPSPAVFPSILTTGVFASGDNDRQGVLRTVDCDHYRAVPLSDGVHILYTDPTSGRLCLGSDAPHGGPTKLLRKIVFIPPDSDNDLHSLRMSCYNASHDLDWGITIVAAYTDGRIVLYHVPSDVWEYVCNLRKASDAWDETSGVLAQSDLLMDSAIDQPGEDASTDPSSGNEASLACSSTPQRTVQIHRAGFAHVGQDGVDDVAVDARKGGLKVWVFCRSGIARQYSIFCDHEPYRRCVRKDGLLHEYETTDGKGKGKARE